jgi:hypothetical protein
MDDEVNDIKKFIVIIRLESALSRVGNKMKVDIGRVAVACNQINSQINAISNKKPQMVFSDLDSVTMGFLIDSHLPAGLIQEKISAGNRPQRILLGSDSILVIELGENFSGFGNALKYSWLQRVR